MRLNNVRNITVNHSLFDMSQCGHVDHTRGKMRGVSKASPWHHPKLDAIFVKHVWAHESQWSSLLDASKSLPERCAMFSKHKPHDD